VTSFSALSLAALSADHLRFELCRRIQVASTSSETLPVSLVLPGENIAMHPNSGVRRSRFSPDHAAGNPAPQAPEIRQI